MGKKENVFIPFIVPNALEALGFDFDACKMEEKATTETTPQTAKKPIVLFQTKSLLLERKVGRLTPLGRKYFDCTSNFLGVAYAQVQTNI